jgi:hypothetical protein
MIVHNSNDVRFKSEQSFFKKNVYALPFLAWRLLFSPHRLSLFKLDFLAAASEPDRLSTAGKTSFKQGKAILAGQMIKY